MKRLRFCGTLATMRKQLSFLEFQAWFPDEESCIHLLLDRRWPDGFVCPKCAGRTGDMLRSRAYTIECRGCGRQTSATAGTIMHRTKLPLRIWFWAAHLMATHSNGMSARQLAAHLGIAYSSAWLLEQKLRRVRWTPSLGQRRGGVKRESRRGHLGVHPHDEW